MKLRRPWFYSSVIVLGLGSISYAFTNCSHFDGQISASSLTGVAGTDFCGGQGSCATPAVPTCMFNGSPVADGAAVRAFLNSTANGACVAEMRLCTGGSLSGSFAYATCATAAPAACLFDGRTVASGQTVTAYRTSTDAACVAETRACTNGMLTGSYGFGSCTPSAPASCLFDGRTVSHGTSVTAYVTSNAPAGGACAPVIRTCYNGALTGVGDYGSCTVEAARACVFNGQTIPSGVNVFAFATSQVPFGSTCTPLVRTCTDGTLSGTGDLASCGADQPAACLINGQTIPSGGTITLYTSSVADLNGACPTEVRTCTNGNLSGSALHTSCVLPSSDDGARVLFAQAGGAFNHLIGHADTGGTWSVTTADGAGVMTYGPYVKTLPNAATLVRFKLAIDNHAANNEDVAVLDVYDATANTVLNSRRLRRQEFQNAFAPQNFALDFTPPAGHAMEFRIRVLGVTALTHVATEVRGEGLQRDMLAWIDSGIDESEYVAVHAEQRQCDPPYDTCGPWTSVTSTFQPFKTRWDNARQKLYWRKDDFEYDFYGEIWNLSAAGLTLRQETVPYLPDFDPKGTSDDWAANGWITPGRFRLFSLDHGPGLTQGVNPWPGAEGRVLAPRFLDWNFNLTQTINTFRCSSWDQFAQGQCPIYQPNFQDTRISVGVVDDFSSDFDGENSTDGRAWVPLPEFRTFERAVVMNQEMFGKARERFFFAERAGRYYGAVRWDNSVYDATRGRWIVTQRTLGVQRRNDHHVTFDGMIQRGLRDH